MNTSLLNQKLQVLRRFPRLEAAGVRVHLRRAEGQVHGFFNLANMLPRAREGALWGIARLRQEFDRAGDAARAGAGRPSPAVG